MKISISDAADLCKKRGNAYVIVFGVDKDGDKFNVTSYGMTKALCKLAGNIANQFADAVLNGRVAPPENEPADNAEITRLRAEVERLREVLRPFSRYATAWHDTWSDDEKVTWHFSAPLYLRDCRRAAAALLEGSR